MKDTIRAVVVFLALVMVLIIFGSMLYRMGANLADIRHDVAALKDYVESQSFDRHEEGQ